jgi:hypothetical protein
MPKPRKKPQNPKLRTHAMLDLLTAAFWSMHDVASLAHTYRDWSQADQKALKAEQRKASQLIADLQAAMNDSYGQEVRKADIGACLARYSEQK